MQKITKAILSYFKDFRPITYVRRTHKKHLLIDVSTIIQDDVGTGIQRVVRSLYLFLLNNSPEGYEIYPIYAEPNKSYRYAKIHFLNEKSPYTEQVVEIQSGDIYCGLDLCAHIIPKHYDELSGWQNKGAKLYFFIHDLLPHLAPQWFEKKSVETFRLWLQTVMMLADGLLCSSTVVQKDIIDYCQQKPELREKNLIGHIIPLGADILASIPSMGLIPKADSLLQQWQEQNTILMVGTIEPRKGYSEILSAFEALWQQGEMVNLLIVGRGGWKTEALQKRLKAHREFNQRLFWLEKVSDEMLERIYKNVKGLIFASEAEGFGLPLVEALYYGKPVLVRDIPIFREIAGKSAHFFQRTTTLELAKDINLWLCQINENPQPKISVRCWNEVGADLVEYLCPIHASKAEKGVT